MFTENNKIYIFNYQLYMYLNSNKLTNENMVFIVKLFIPQTNLIAIVKY